MGFSVPSVDTYGPEIALLPRWAHTANPPDTDAANQDLSSLVRILERNHGQPVTATLAKEIGSCLEDFAATIEGGRHGYLHHCSTALYVANRMYQDGETVRGYPCKDDEPGRYRRQMFLIYGWRLLSVVQASIQTDARFFCTRSGGDPTLGCSVILSLRNCLDKSGCFCERVYDMDTDNDTACFAMDVIAFLHLLYATKCLIVQLNVLKNSMNPDAPIISRCTPFMNGLRCPMVVHPSVEYTFSFFEGSREDLEAQSDAMGAHLLFPATWDDMWAREESERSIFYDAHDFYEKEIRALEEESRLIREANVRHLRNIKKKKKCVFTKGRVAKKAKTLSP